jgi:hypothetical protein
MSDAGDIWSEAWIKGQQELLKAWSSSAGGGPLDWSALASALGAPPAEAFQAEALRRFLGLYEQYFGVTRTLWDRLQGGQGGAPGADWLRAAPFDAPALGLGREVQAAWQRIARLSARAADAQSRFGLRWAQLLQDAARAVAERAAQQAAAGEPVRTLKALYDLWVECAERAHAEAAHGSEYIELQAEFINATSELRIEQRALIERWARELDLPTRAEIDSVHRRLKDLGARLQSLEVPKSPARRAARKKRT